LIPIAIMIDGKFYDAQSYKADPTPMALWTEVVYEGEKTGVSEGLFTVSGAMQNPQTGQWAGDGSWLTTDELKKSSASKPKFGSDKPRDLDPDSGPPVLRHSGAKKPEPPDASGGSSSSSQTPTSSPAGTAANTSPASAPSSSSTTTQQPTAGQSSQSTASKPAPSSATGSSSPSTNAPADNDEKIDESDPNRPTLKRGKQAPRPEVKDTTPVVIAANKPAANASLGSSPSSTNTAPSGAKKSQATVEFIPAISDEGGPPAQSYAYNVTGSQEVDFKQKMLAMAGDEIKVHAKQMQKNEIGGTGKPASPATTAHSAARAKTAARDSGPQFKDVKMKVFDLTNGNEPTVVMMAKAEPAASSSSASAATSGSGIEQWITLIAREDINGDFHKIFASVTDEKHLDVEPQWQLVDAVDANGDGNGELLFQKVSDSGSAFGIYRVIGNQLYPIFEGVQGNLPVVGAQ
jgi:hypothetical protein